MPYMLAVPVGTVLDFLGAAVPPGWLECDGAEVSRATYAALFSVLAIERAGALHQGTDHYIDGLSTTEDLFVGMAVEGGDLLPPPGG